MSEYHFLPRRELTEKALKSITEYPLAVFIAPMGYGKTTLAEGVVELAGESSPSKAYYYSVPEGPHDANFLWHDIFEQLEAQGMNAAPAIRRLGFPETASQRLQVFELLRGLTPPTFLIIDDYQQVTDQGMNVFLDVLTLAAIPGFHLALFSRTRPDMRLEELRIKRLAVLHEQDFLAFSEEETKEYLQLNGISEAASPKVAKDAWQFCEGWPAALWLCLQNWRSSGAILATDSIDSLMRKVFSGYDKEEQDLLLCLSVMETFTEEDATKIKAVPQTPARLWALRGKNALLSLNRKTNHFKFHSMFKEFLRKELADAGNIDKPALYRIAAECYLKRIELANAFRMCARAGRDEDLMRLLDFFLHYEHDESCAYFYEEIFAIAIAIPWRVRMQHPLGWLAFVATYMAIWNDTRTGMLLEEAEERFALAADTMPKYLQKRVKGECEAVRGMLAFNDMEKTFQHYSEAVRLLNGPSKICCLDSLWSFGSPNMSFITVRKPDEFDRLIAHAEQNLRLYRTLSGGYGEGADKAARAEYWLERGEFTPAEALLFEILRSCSIGRNKEKNLTTLLVARFSLARLYAASGRPEEAAHMLEAMRSHISGTDAIMQVDCVELAEGYIHAICGNLKSIPQWLREGRVLEPPHALQPQVFGFSLTIYGKALMLQEEWHHLAHVAEKIPDSTPQECLFARIHGAILSAVAAWHINGQDKALSFLNKAMELSHSDGIVLSLAEYGGHILPLLRLLKRKEYTNEHLEKIEVLAKRITAISSMTNSNKNGLLTPREKELLRLVAQGKSNPVIAKNLGISSDTVKEHLSRVYAKLGVTGRMEAAYRFTELFGNGASELFQS